MTIDLRVLAAEQWDLFYERLERAFNGPADPPEERAQWRRVTELERASVAWDGDELVGTAGAFTFRMTVPGGALLGVAGVTMVSVQATHRRRGVLTSMMRSQLDDIRDRGEPVAVLTASEPAIYGRFGYGIATHQMRGTVDTTRVAFSAPEGADAVRIRLVSPAEARETCEAVYAQVVPGRAGMLARQPGWDTQPLVDPPAARRGAGPLLCALAEVDGAVRGYARYSVTPEWSPAGADSTVNLRDLEALDPAAYAALWRYLASIDLTAEIGFYNRPVDDPMLHLVSDIRRCALGVRDSLHLRLVDVGAALEARTYAAPVDVVLDVEDAFCPWNSGRWRLTGDTKGAACERTTDPADLALPVRQLGAAYLGGFSLHAMAAAGHVRELRAGALPEASGAFLTAPAPWLPHGF
jgi:predicted acetyltransferase